MAGNQGKFRIGQLAIEYVEIGSTDCAGSDLKQGLPWAGLRDWQVRRIQSLLRSAKNHCAHEEIEPQSDIRSRRVDYRAIDEAGQLGVAQVSNLLYRSASSLRALR